MNEEEILAYLHELFQMHFLLKKLPMLVDFAKVINEEGKTFVYIDHEGTNLRVKLRFNPQRKSFFGIHNIVSHYKMVQLPNPNAL